MCPIYLTWALNLALVWESETIHGIPMWKAKPAPVNVSRPSAPFRVRGKALSSNRWGGSKAEAGWKRRAEAVLRELELLDLRVGRGRPIGAVALLGERGRLSSDPSDPSRRMTGSMICDENGVLASGGSSVELEGDRTDGLNSGSGIDGGGKRLRMEVLLVVDAVEVVRKRAVGESGFEGLGATGLAGVRCGWDFGVLGCLEEES